MSHSPSGPAPDSHHGHDHAPARASHAQGSAAADADQDHHRSHAQHDHAHHDHGHPHAHAAGNATTRAFALGTLINLGFTAVEGGYGLATGSLALLSDALHNLGDALGLALGWFAARLALRPASARRTYGYRRATLLAPLGNALLLVGGTGALAWEAVRRLAAPPSIDAWPVVVVAALAIFVNLGSALLFRHGHAHDLNQRGAYLHLLTDAAVSFAVVLGGLGMAWLGWRLLDPLLALGVGVVVLLASWRLLRDSLDLALDAVPRGIDRDAVTRWLAQQDGVVAVHHVHIWALGSTETALTAHLVRPAAADNDAFLQQLRDGLQRGFGIGHATLQVEHGARDSCAPCRSAARPAVASGGPRPL